MNEEWKDIEGYEGCYQISNLGRVKSLPKPIVMPNSVCRYSLERILIPQNRNIARQAYKKIDLSKNGTVRQISVHRLVAIAFIPNPENKPCVNHINRDGSDNRSSNLEWCTYKENTNHWLKDSGKRVIKKEYSEVETEYLIHNDCTVELNEYITSFNLLLMGADAHKYGTVANPDVVPNMTWSHIDGYNGFYIISEYGHVISLPRTVIRQNQYPSGKTLKVSGFLLKQHISNDRFQVPISKNGHYKKLYPHKLVAASFIKQPPNSIVVNHKDGNPLNNHFTNLEWTSNSQNQLHCYKNKLRVSKSGSNHWRSKKVEMGDANGNVIGLFGSTGDIFREYNLSMSSISNVCTGKRSEYKGFKFKYV